MLQSIPEREKGILQFWQEHQIFKASLNKPSPKGSFIFFDGPPFATGTPHYGHIVANLMKDAVPRYFTMQGYTVPRRWGWDCHGLPIENIVEEELGSKSKQDIENTVGVAAFNERCLSKVLRYANDWKKFIPRIGRWVDMDNPYQTMDTSYMETVWWAFKQLWDKGLIYEGHKAMHICPRCETTLSQSEVAQGYKDITDVSAVVTFPLVDQPDTSLLAWTTTPWSLPDDVALAVAQNITYTLVKHEEKKYILAKDTLEKVFFNKKYAVLQELKGSALVGKAYQPLFPYFADKGKGTFHIYAADFVTTTEGTGIVHIAPAFGEDDLTLGKEHGLPWIQHVNFSGMFTNEVKDFAGLHVKQINPPASPFVKGGLKGDLTTDEKIIAWLKEHGRLFSSQDYTHSYPHCWRCDTPLLNYTTNSLFINVTKLKPRMLELARDISWVPSHLKEGRFGKWLEGAQDWSISRQRFWGSVIPIWKCDTCKKQVVIGSIKELQALSGKKVDDLHKHVVDEVTWKCTGSSGKVDPCRLARINLGQDCHGTMHRVSDVLDCWFESAVMPWAQNADQARPGQAIPADFVAEGVDQTRCWFYYMLVIAMALEDKIPFKHVIANGIVLAENGQKMSKHLQNYPDPTAVIEKYGADALRYYLLTSPVMKAESLQFSEQGVKEVYQKVVMILTNVVTFYKMYGNPSPCPLPQGEREKTREESSPRLSLYGRGPRTAGGEGAHVLDQWILSRLNGLTATITKHMNAYDLVEATRPIAPFVDDLSTWYIRRSRDRFKAGDPSSLQTTYYVLRTFSKLLAPFMPFMAEWIWQELPHLTSPWKGEEPHHPSPYEGEGRVRLLPSSVHLSDWPQANSTMINTVLEEQMSLVRKICELGHALREEAGMKVRQPLAELRITPSPKTLSLEGRGQGEGALLPIIQEELNIKLVTVIQEPPTHTGWISKTDGPLTVSLFTELTPELKTEGLVRELVRTINGMRKDAGLTIKDIVSITFDTSDETIKKSLESFLEDIKTQTLAKTIVFAKVEGDWKEISKLKVAIQKC